MGNMVEIVMLELVWGVDEFCWVDVQLMWWFVVQWQLNEMDCVVLWYILVVFVE